MKPNESDEEYLQISKEFLQKEMSLALKRIRKNKAQIIQLQINISKMKDDDEDKIKLMTKHNTLTIEKNADLHAIKAGRVDLKHVNSILRKLKRHERYNKSM